MDLVCVFLRAIGFVRLLLIRFFESVSFLTQYTLQHLFMVIVLHLQSRFFLCLLKFQFWLYLLGFYDSLASLDNLAISLIYTNILCLFTCYFWGLLCLSSYISSLFPSSHRLNGFFYFIFLILLVDFFLKFFLFGILVFI